MREPDGGRTAKTRTTRMKEGTAPPRCSKIRTKTAKEESQRSSGKRGVGRLRCRKRDRMSWAVAAETR